jgi:hypothetical protein
MRKASLTFRLSDEIVSNQLRPSHPPGPTQSIIAGHRDADVHFHVCLQGFSFLQRSIFSAAIRGLLAFDPTTVGRRLGRHAPGSGRPAVVPAP